MILSWRHVLQSIGLLLTYASDETVNEWVLTCLEKYAFFCARFALQETTICSIEVLASYALPSQLSKAIFDKPIWRLEKDCFDFRYKISKAQRELNIPSQILVIGQPLIPVTGVNGQGFVCLTAKNMQVMQALIRLGRQASLFLSDAWLPLLYGFAHGAWIMGLRADVEKADGSLTITRNNVQSGPSNDPTLVTTAARNRLAFIAAEIQKVFDTAAQELDEVPLHHLVSALGQLSQQELECSLNQVKRNKQKQKSKQQDEEENTSENQSVEQTEPGLFALSQLVRVANCCVLTNRANLVLSPVSGHLFEACGNTHKPVRTFAARSLCSLVRQYLNKEPTALAALRPINRLSEVQYIDVKTIQIEFLERMIDQHGQNFNEEQWIKILDMVRSACNIKDTLHKDQTDDVLRLGLKQAQQSGNQNLTQLNSPSNLVNPMQPTHDRQNSSNLDNQTVNTSGIPSNLSPADSKHSDTGPLDVLTSPNPASNSLIDPANPALNPQTSVENNPASIVPLNIDQTTSVNSNVSQNSNSTNSDLRNHHAMFPYTKPSAILAKSAFRLLQLICDEFLEMISSTGERALFKLIRACGSIGQQTFELNVSLTAVGLLWSICDFLGSRGNPDLDPEEDENNLNSVNNMNNLVLGTIKRMKQFDAGSTINWHESLVGILLNDKDIAALTATTVMHQHKLQNGWLAIFSELALLCMNSRPAMRKSAVQSLFQTINAHVEQLNEITTDCLLYIIVRLPQGCNPPLAKKSSKEDDKKAMESSFNSQLSHHSRDTLEKQWAETRATVLTGMAKVIAEARVIVDHRHWVACLSEISLATKTPSPEVCNAALIGLKTLLDKKNVSQINDKRKPQKHRDRDENGQMVSTQQSELSSNWRMAWNCWLEIGRSKTVPLPVKSENLCILGDLTDVQKLLIIHTEQAYVLLKRMTENQISKKDKVGAKNRRSRNVEYQSEFAGSAQIDPQLAFEGLGLGDLKSLFEMLTRTLSLPVLSDWPPIPETKYEDGYNPIMASMHSGLAIVKPQLTQLQAKCLGIVHQAQVMSNSVLQHHLLPLIFDFLLTHSQNLWEPPKVAAQGDISKYVQGLNKNKSNFNAKNWGLGGRIFGNQAHKNLLELA